MAKYIVTATAEELTRRLIADLACGRATSNGDRTSEYFQIARAGDGEPQGGDVTVSLIEYAHDLDGGAPYYGLHIVDDVAGADCDTQYTDELTEAALSALLNELIAAYKAA